MNKLQALILTLLILPALVIAQKGKQPNVVFILTDDLDYINTRQYFEEVLPSLTELNNKGVEFTHYYASSSSCCPSRAAILSGRYGFETEVLNNGKTHGGGWAYFKDDEAFTLPVYLAEQGYKTAFMGKYMNGYKPRGPVYGWTDGFMSTTTWKAYEGYGYTIQKWSEGHKKGSSWQGEQQFIKYKKEPEDYITDVLTEQSIEFITNAQKADKPFFLLVSPTAPHIPMGPAPRDLEKTKERWLNNGAPSSPNSFSDKGRLAEQEDAEAIPEDKPYWLKKSWKKRIREQKGRTGMYNTVSSIHKAPKEINNYRDVDWYYRMGSLYAVDDMIRKIITTLKEQELWDNTIFIFSSDNGYQFGNHGLYQKSSPYEESVRIPLIIASGDSIQLNRGITSKELVLNVDIAPTILNLADIDIPDRMSGQSFKSLLTGKAGSIQTRDVIILEYNGPGMALDFFPMWMSFHLKLLPSFMLDYPPYRGIIAKVKEGDKETLYKYIQWIKKPGKYRRQSRRAKSFEEKQAVWTSFEKEEELYNMGNDSFELDNLLYYKHEEYKLLRQLLKEKLEEAYD